MPHSNVDQPIAASGGSSVLQSVYAEAAGAQVDAPAGNPGAWTAAVTANINTVAGSALLIRGGISAYNDSNDGRVEVSVMIDGAAVGPIFGGPAVVNDPSIDATTPENVSFFPIYKLTGLAAGAHTVSIAMRSPRFGGVHMNPTQVQPGGGAIARAGGANVLVEEVK